MTELEVWTCEHGCKEYFLDSSVGKIDIWLSLDAHRGISECSADVERYDVEELIEAYEED